MNDRQENKLGMFRATAQVLTDHASAFAGVPAMATQHQNLRDSITLIDSLAQAQAAATTGVTVDKKNFQEQMTSYALRVAGAVKACASVANNQTLAKKTELHESDFSRARDDARDDLAQGVHDDAQGVLASLADYGVTAATLSRLANPDRRLPPGRLASPPSPAPSAAPTPPS